MAEGAIGCAALGLFTYTPCAAQDALNTIDWRVSLDQQQSGTPASDNAWWDLGHTRLSQTAFRNDRFTERLSVRSTTPLEAPESSPYRDSLPWADSQTDIAYQRDWKPAFGRTASGLEVSLTPHTGITYSTHSTSAEAGATLRIGQNIRELAQNGDTAFGDRPRWYVFAAGSKRAVGYNLTRGRDGDLDRAGISHDEGGTFGDASIGVAYRRGMIQSSIGIIYRENETKGLRSFEGLKTDVDEAILAFQFSIRPR